VVEESTELVNKSSEDLISRQVLMAEEGEDDGHLSIDEFDAVSEELTPAMKMTPIVRHGGPRIGLAQLTEGGSMSACDPCITSLTPNSLP
jgi:hypothetical protein